MLRVSVLIGNSENMCVNRRLLHFQDLMINNLSTGISMNASLSFRLEKLIKTVNQIMSESD
ncbi:hypothetical protein BABINDRAFT_163051 [Babjeviella inositovora NRRL Y-12698]|uniref:Uncharacterized protein n=1 Tax=Babjeviella inositovora NRRL Y-12698 TaxID=984486 RepID=A0A1E3QKM4_9ASCO|nr:uncharacterized protein BABINDRAFT_163051 [Babjeviella inositovora NRRL Y-12698]ODQ78004.1 hypothetical protein BABINDRAFT_163051 [Babjeviella inositovora NRRL Y-12698]